MEYSGKLKIQLHSGKGLKDVKNVGIMSPYAVIHIIIDGKETIHKTNIAKKGDSDPIWDCSMVFNDVSINENFNLVIEIKHSGTFFDRKIGLVEVPFKDLLKGDASGDKLSYRVTTGPGQTQGEILLSHSFTEVVERSGNGESFTSSSSSSSSSSNTSTNTNTSTSSNNLDADVSGKKKDGKAKRVAKKVVGVVSAIGVSIGAEVVENVIGDKVNDD